MKKSTCPVCDAVVTLPEGIEESEIISCGDCHTRLVVASLKREGITLKEAPKVEEDWGE